MYMSKVTVLGSERVNNYFNTDQYSWIDPFKYSSYPKCITVDFSNTSQIGLKKHFINLDFNLPFENVSSNVHLLKMKYGGFN